MTDKSKVFKIVIQGETKDIEKQLQTIRATASAAGLEITKAFSNSNEKLGTTTTRVDLLSQKLQETRRIAEQFDKAFDKAGLNKYVTDAKTGLTEIEKILRNVSSNLDRPGAKLAETLAARVKAFKEASAQAQRMLNENLGVTNTSSKAKAQTAAEELRIRRDLAAKVAQLEKSLADKTITNLGVANAKRTALFNKALAEISQLRAAADASIQADIAKAARLKANALEEKEMIRQIAAEDKQKYLDRKRFYENWINESHALHQQEIADTKRKNAQIRQDTTQMYKEMFDEIARREKQAQQRADAARRSPLIRGMSNAPSMSSLLLTAGMTAAGQQAAQIRPLPNIIPPGATANVNNHAAAINNLSLSHRSLLGHVASVILEYRILNSLLNSVGTALRNIPRAGIEQQATEASLLGIFGTQAAEENIQFISDLADKAGANLVALEQSYRKYAPAAALAGASQREVNKSFQDFTETASILHLSTDKLNSLFLALEQMYSKGTVQSEEIKRQLGNVLPGAVEIGAKAMGKTPAAFMAAMKKNEVTAREFVPKFAALYRQIFGGENDQIFLSVRDKLLSNLQRVSNEYTRVNREIFSQVETLLNDIARTSGTALKVFRENLTGVGQVVQIVAGLLVGRLGIALVATTANTYRAAIANSIYAASFVGPLAAQDKAIFNSVLMNTAWLKLRQTGVLLVGTLTAITGMSAPVLASAAAVATLASQVSGLGLAYSEARGFTVTFRDEQVSLVNYLKSIFTVTMQAMRDGWKSLAESAGDAVLFIIDKIVNLSEESKAKIRQAAEDLGNAFKDGLFDTILPNENDWSEFKASINTMVRMASEASMKMQDENKIYQEELEKIKKQKPFAFEAAQEADVKDTLAELAGKSVLDVQKAIADGRIKRAEDITKALEKAIDIKQNPDLFSGNDLTDAGLNAKTAAAAKARNAIYKDITRDTKLAVTEIQNELKSLDRAYDVNTVSIEEYYSTKLRLMQQVQEKESIALDKQKQIAAAAGDTSKAEEFQDKFEQLQEQWQGKQDEIFAKRQEALKNLTATFEQTESAFLKIIGRFDEAAQKDFSNQNRDRLNRLMAEFAAQGNTSEQAANALKQYKIEESSYILKGKMERLELNISKAQKEYEAAQERINVRRNIGLISELTATKEVLAIRDDYIAALDVAIASLEKEVAANSMNVELQQKLVDLKREQAAIKSEGSGFGHQFMEGQLPDYLQNFRKNQAALTQGRQADLKAITETAIPYKNATTTYTNMLEVRRQADREYILATASNYSNLFGGIFAQGANTFLGLTQASQKMYGEQSKQARTAFAMYKAMKIGEIIMSTAGAIMNALATSGNIYVGLGLAAMSAAMGAVQLATVISQPMPQGAAHGGLDYVPKEQTYLLDKGERVVSPRQNKDLTKFLNQGSMPGKQEKQTINIYNITDKNLIWEAMRDPEGEQIVMNHIGSNR